MDKFCQYPTVVQHNILRQMDLQSFFKTARTSKAMMELAKGCTDKCWDVELHEDPEANNWSVSEDRVQALRIENLDTLELLFHGSTVMCLRLDRPIPKELDIRCRYLQLERNASLTVEGIIAKLKLHKSAKKYYVEMNAVSPNEVLLELLNENVDGLDAELVAPAPAYIRLKVPRMTLRNFQITDPCYATWARMLVEEWLDGIREIRYVHLHDFSFRDRLADFCDHAFHRPYPKLWLMDEQSAYYYIKREDGNALIMCTDYKYHALIFTHRDVISKHVWFNLCQVKEFLDAVAE